MIAYLDAATGALIAVGIGCLLGWILLTALRRLDHDTWVYARAPELPVHALAVGDDAWLRGNVVCPEPLVCPWFRAACVAFRYAREREHTWTTTDKDGNTTTHSEWRTEFQDSRARDFELDDGQRILVRMANATNEAMRALPTFYERSDLRHCASVIEVGALVSVLGVKQDDGSFARQSEVPCLLTRKSAADRVRSSGRSETVTFTFAWLLPALAGGVAAWLLQRDNWRNEPSQVAATAGAAVLLALPFWGVGTYNRLVRLRQQVLAAFRQVDVDLAVRAALVPNLTAVVQQAAAHEQGLLRDLAAIRSGLDPHAAVAAERGAAAASRQVLLLHERYPDLTTDAVYRDLHDRLWACEEKLAHTRQLYNDVVREWNDRLQRFPSSLVAKLARGRPAPFFAGDDQPVPPRLRA
jgi:LemA protein